MEKSHRSLGRQDRMKRIILSIEIDANVCRDVAMA